MRTSTSFDAIWSTRFGKRRCWVNCRTAAKLEVELDSKAIAELANGLLDDPATWVETLKDDRRSTVNLCQWRNQYWVVKRYHDTPWRVLHYHFVRRTPAWREWFGAQHLRHASARVVDVFMLVHEERWGRWSQTLITPYIAAPSLQKWIQEYGLAVTHDRLVRRQRLELAKSIGTQVGQLSAVGCFNRDHKIANLLIDSVCEPGRAVPLIIDPARVIRGRSNRYFYRMMASLAWSAEIIGYADRKGQVACLRAALAKNENVAHDQPHRLQYAAEQIAMLLEKYRRIRRLRLERQSPAG